MICSLLVDADDSIDFPGNTASALGRPLAAYPMMAARGSAAISRHYAVTASLPVKSVARQNAAVIIDPGEGAGRQALIDQGLRFIVDDLKGEKAALELLCVFSAQAPCITTELVDEGIHALQDKTGFDSAASVSQYNRLHPAHARREGPDGALEPLARAASQPGHDVWYPDQGVELLRPGAFERGARKTLALKQQSPGPVDFKWQLPAVEAWLKDKGFSDLTPTLELQPKPQPQAAPREGRR